MTNTDAAGEDGNDARLLQLSPQDNVVVLIANVAKGETLRIAGAPREMAMDVAYGHKLAARPIARGEKIFKYGAPIGSATADIAAGDYVHIHNIKSDYIPTYNVEGGA